MTTKLLHVLVLVSAMLPVISIRAQERKQNLDSAHVYLDSTIKLEDVVVTALGVKRNKRNLTYSTQEVKGNDIMKTQEPNVLNSLTGKVAGVTVNTTSGAPGAASSIIIRGVSSLLGNNQALIVLDGIPINNDERNSGGDGGAGSSGLGDIDPSIIENINILKGAAATALYGSAGARGVVLITTKNGEKGRKPTVSISSNYSFDKAILPDRQLKYAQGSGGIYVDGESTKTSGSWGPNIDSLYVNGEKVQFHNPLKEFLKTGNTSSTTVSVNGGNATSNYFLSYTYLDQSGTVPATDFSKNNLFAKFFTQITDKISATTQISYSYSKNRFANQGYGLQSPLTTVASAPISYDFFPYYNEDGTQRLYRYSRNNPYWVLDNVGNTSGTSRIIPMFTLVYRPMQWLSFTERIGADIYADKYNYHVNIGDISYSSGRLISRDANFRQINHDFIAQANTTINKFSISGMLGNNILTTNYNQLQTNGTGLGVSGYYNMQNASSVTSSESMTTTRKVGFYAQAEIVYDRLLILALSGRYDGSSVLSQENQFYPYGSAALGFVFSELFNRSTSSIMNFGKFRISYASVGNDNVGAYSNTTPYYQASTNVVFPYQGQNGFLIGSSLGNSSLKNELQKEFEIGLETKFFNSRIGLEASYFVRNMSNGLVSGIDISDATGYSTTTINSAKLRTKGLELLLTATPVRTANFNWDVVVNFSNPKTTVLQIGRTPGELASTSIGFTYAVEGQTYGLLYGSKYARNDQGQLLIDASGLPYTSENGYLGSAMPDWTAGITNNFKYKNFGLGFQFDTRQGGYIHNYDDGYNLYYGVSIQTLNREDFIVPGVYASNGAQNTTVVKAEPYWQRVSGITEELIQKSAFIKLRNVNINYTLNKSSFKNAFFKEAVISVTGRNLWIKKDKSFTGSDPESNSSFGTGNGSLGGYSFTTPASRSFTVGLKLTF